VRSLEVGRGRAALRGTRSRRCDDADRDSGEEPADEEAGELFHARKTIVLTIETPTAGSRRRPAPVEIRQVPSEEQRADHTTAYTRTRR